MGLEKLQQQLGHQFRETALLKQALRHSDYERLEFLGDRILGLLVAEMLYRLFPDDAEGDMARRHANLVCQPVLAQIAERLALGTIMQLDQRGGGEQALRHTESILADMVEALIAAVYLDSGANLAAVRHFVEHFWTPYIDHMPTPPLDAKTRLQEWSQGKGLGLPSYSIVDKTGPDHAPHFRVAVQVSSYEAVTAEGSSRRKAEQEAATLMLEKLGIIEEEQA